MSPTLLGTNSFLLTLTFRINETTYLFDKHHWQRGHIGHFGFRAVQTHSMLEHAKEWNISDIKTIFFMTDDFPRKYLSTLTLF